MFIIIYSGMEKWKSKGAYEKFNISNDNKYIDPAYIYAHCEAFQKF